MIKLSSVVIDTPNVKKLSNFYQNFLGWEVKIYDHGENGIWSTLKDKNGNSTRIVFQENKQYQKPIWPSKRGA